MDNSKTLHFKQGTFNFDKNGKLIYDSKNSEARKFINGILVKVNGKFHKL